MRFCTFQVGRKTTAGMIQGKRVFDLGQAFFRIAQASRQVALAAIPATLF